MDEVRRYLRFTLPGLTVIFVFFIVCLFSEKLYASEKFLDFIKNSGLGSSALVLVAATAFGYLFSNIYFVVYWKPRWLNLAINHIKMLESLSDKLEILDQKNNRIEFNKNDKAKAWRITAQIWNSMVRKKEVYKREQTLLARLVDVKHMVGATWVGFILAFFLWAYIHGWNGCSGIYNGWKFYIVWIAIIYTTIYNWKIAKTSHEKLTNSVVVDVINQSYITNKSMPLKIWYYNDLDETK